jgi:hypothetical protein
MNHRLAVTLGEVHVEALGSRGHDVGKRTLSTATDLFVRYGYTDLANSASQVNDVTA